MDPITHAASGAVAMLAMPNRPATRWAVPLAAIAAASPDIDVTLCHTPLEFLLLHRGITHSLAAAPLLGLLLTLLARPMWKPGTPGHWSFSKVWLFMICMVLLHIWLDVITTYGTMIYLPFSYERVRLNAVYIIDLLLTLPLLWAVLRWRAKRGLMRMALAWVFVYPALCIGLNAWHTAQTESRLAAEGQNTQQTVQKVVLLPDAFGPLFWRTLYETDGPGGRMVYSQGLNALGQPRNPATGHRAAPPELLAELARQSVAAEAFFGFTVLPVISPLADDFKPAEALAGATSPALPETAAATAATTTAGTTGTTGGAATTDAVEATTPTGTPDAASTASTAGNDTPAKDTRLAYVLFNDLRFGSDLAFVRAIIASRPNADVPFKYMAELELAGPNEVASLVDEGQNPDGARLVRERLRFSDSGKDSHWQSPRVPTPPSFWDWLIGLR
ncbi:MAG: metal-dependent hydrolase [Desulfovibrio sp.]|uniref:metal-dependent hydrolase n=1 Tax=Desulfovibrio sp. TaxID=885 RepID=UPI0039E4AC18